jgi:hypothetical protein
MEMQQAARLAAFQIADEIRLAGQGAPIYAFEFDRVLTEDSVVILAGSDSSRIRFRAGLSNAQSEVAAPTPLAVIAGVPLGLTLTDSSRLAGNAGKHVFLSGPISAGVWGWTRAVLGTYMQITPLASVQFVGIPTISLDEAIAVYRDGAAIRRTTATDMASSAAPTWAPANELAINVVALRFDYFDADGVAIVPDSLVNRGAVRRVSVSLTIRSSRELSNGTRPEFSIRLTSNLRNLHGGFAYRRSISS